MSTFADAFDAWKRAEADAESAPTTETRQAAQQAHFALRHHPAAHRGRDQIEGRERNRREGRR